MKVISKDYVYEKAIKIKHSLEYGEVDKATNVLNTLLKACETVSDTSKGLDKGEVIKWK